MTAHAFRTVSTTSAVLMFVAASQVSAQGAGEVYSAFGCGACHGEEGRGSALGPSIATRELAAADFIDYVRSPTGTMPAYDAETVSDRSLTDMHAYLEPPFGQADPPGSVEPGAALYRQTGCYQCHANEGQGGAQGPRLGPDPLTLARFTWYVRNPGGGMPPYTEVVMTDQDLADVHAFLAARPQPPDVESIPLLAP
jgi:mono/diheme cytochrome c family protein